MAAASWPPSLISKMARDIFKHYDSDEDGYLQHKVHAEPAQQLQAHSLPLSTIPPHPFTAGCL